MYIYHPGVLIFLSFLYATPRLAMMTDSCAWDEAVANVVLVLVVVAGIIIDTGIGSCGVGIGCCRDVFP